MILDQRATEPELLDGRDIDAEQLAESVRLCAISNRLLGGTRVVRKFLEAEVRRAPTNRPLRVLDIGSGNGSIPLAVSRWAIRRGLNVEFVCLERNPHAALLARQAVHAANDSRVRVVDGDIFTHQPDEPYDCAIGSMFFHHLGDDVILALLERLRSFVRRTVLVNDLQRCVACYAGCALMSRRFSREVRHDANLSIRRGFRRGSLLRLLRRMKGVSVSVTRYWFCRLAGVIHFDWVSKERP